MTVIAYRNGTIACDTRICLGDSMLGASRKIARNTYGDLAGGAGSAATVDAFLHWFTTGEKNDMPEMLKDDHSFDRCIVIRKDTPLRATIFEPDGQHTITLSEGYFAIGSGRPEALGAMFAGADPEQAVRAAIAHDVHCGGEVMVLQHG